MNGIPAALAHLASPGRRDQHLWHEIRNSQDAAKIAGREDAKRMKNLRPPGRPDLIRIMVGQNVEKATR